ncbi:hypothetical protein [Agitococcus lubricus]|uniref:Uncharacterized protein n=1 Tax=Agitococcus lubricus TaxID=1077255 RepID=A0A2T5J1D3_9GAMM|nr:hypothetical protein [Agitococcus lubricus]PTQ90252.1 hypothetical protein C8N29_1034 [Agitococcus lubricus]
MVIELTEEEINILEAVKHTLQLESIQETANYLIHLQLKQLKENLVVVDNHDNQMPSL